MKFKAEVELAERAARKAGHRLEEMMTEEKVVLSETENDIKLQADRDAEAIILEALAESGLPVLAEETGAHRDISNGQPHWVVDPLDGSFNFSRGLPVCSIAIGLRQDDQPQAGVVFDFNRNECFTGVAGEGAWLNHRPIHVSRITDPAHASVAMGYPKRRELAPEEKQSFTEMLDRFKKVRLLGSACLSAAYVACGRVDAFIERDAMFWDVVAGAAVVKGAGGTAEIHEDPSGVPWRCNVRFAGNPLLWDAS